MEKSKKGSKKGIRKGKFDRLPAITPKVLELKAMGLKSKEIGKKLGVSSSWVDQVQGFVNELKKESDSIISTRPILLNIAHLKGVETTMKYINSLSIAIDNHQSGEDVLVPGDLAQLTKASTNATEAMYKQSRLESGKSTDNTAHGIVNRYQSSLDRVLKTSEPEQPSEPEQ